MKYIFATLILACVTVFSQQVSAQETNNEIFTIVEESPTFPGGNQAISAFLSQNLVYPQSALKDKIEGTVYVTFVVEKDGSVSNVKIIQGIHPDCDAEVIRVVKTMPNWTPGKQRGKAVRVQFNLPVKFRL